MAASKEKMNKIKHIEFISEPFEMNTARGISMEEDLNNKDPPKNQQYEYSLMHILNLYVKEHSNELD